MDDTNNTQPYVTLPPAPVDDLDALLAEFALPDVSDYVETNTVTAAAAEPLDESSSVLSPGQIISTLLSMRDQIDDMLKLLQTSKGIAVSQRIRETNITSEDEQKSLEGTFDGEKMIDDIGEVYAIPPNYASKSKLVEGDRLKLTITQNGSFIYKQVQQIARKRLVGHLSFDNELNQWTAVAEGKPYKILKASVTFYKGTIGDEVILLVPEGRSCTWGTVDNLVKI